MLTIFTRSVLLYIASLLAIRAMGKREVGQLMPFELVVVIMIAELAATPMGGVGIPLLYGILPMIALVVCHGVIAALCMKCQPFRKWLSGQPAVLIRDGVICEKQMRKSAMNLNDLMEAIRTAGVLDPSEVGFAILEPGGQVNVFPKSDYRSVAPCDVGLKVPKEGLPLPLVMDGVIQHDNLKRGNLTVKWLENVLREAGFNDPKQMLFCCLNTQGEMLLQNRSSTKTMLKSVLKPEEVTW